MDWRFGDFALRPGQRRLLRAGQPQALGPRAFDLLVLLVEHRDRVLSKDELLQLAWPGLIVEENNLTVQISALRKVVGASAIVTLPGRGYRFVEPVIGQPEPVTGSGAVPLPAGRVALIGREAESAALADLLTMHRLVTLTGAGGAGKTCLALQVGRGASEAGRRTVVLADLSTIRDPDELPRVVAVAFGVDLGDAPPGPASGPAGTRLVKALAPHEGLLILDNCEHVLDVARPWVDALLDGCPGLSVLATSREPLGLIGEQIFPVPPLAVPDGDQPDEVTDAMRLFAARAAEVRPGFALAPDTLAPVATICRALDGLPLAIEFAAARAGHLSVGEIAERLPQCLKPSTGAMQRGAHQQTLASALTWSHDLLPAADQVTFRRLSVFAGGFDLALAEAVCGGPGAEDSDVLDRLASLVDKSLVVAEPTSRGPMRYRLLQTVRLFAAQKLEEAGETAALRARHRDAMLAWLEAMPQEDLTFDLATFDRIGRETDNLQLAAAWSEQQDRPDLLARQVVCVWNFCFWSSYFAHALRHVRWALQDPSRLPVDLRRRAHLAQALFEKMALDLPALHAHADHAVNLAAAPADHWRAAALVLRGHARAALAGFPGADPQLAVQARKDMADALSLFDRGEPAVWRAMAAVFHGWIEVSLGDLDAAVRRFGQAAELGDRSGAQGWPIPAAWSGLAVAHLLCGRRVEAGDAARRFLVRPEVVTDNSPWTASLAIELIPALCAAGHDAQADAQLRIGARRMRRSGVPLAANSFLIMAAGAAFERGQPERCARLLSAARHAAGADREPMPFRTALGFNLHQHYAAQTRAALGREAAHAAREHGRAMALDDAFAMALQGVGHDTA